jgi:hypothetical protein
VLLGGALAAFAMLPALTADAQTSAQPAPRAVTPAAAPAESDLGGGMLREYCQSLGYADSVQDSSSATGWYCVGNAPTIVLSLDLSCRWQFSDMVAAGFTIYNVNGHCKTISTTNFRISDLGQIVAYCRSLGYANATANATGVNPTNNVAAWRCVTSQNGRDGVLFKIDLHAACRWVNPQYVQSGYTVVSYFPNYGAYLGITCIGVVR